ncbi:MAG: aconitase X swivel domain-containing protein [Acutalibacteraceae bacterium]
MKTFKGRVVAPGNVQAEAVVSKQGFNTLASMQMMFIQSKTKCVDQNNSDLYKKILMGKALCLPQTIGSTTGGMFLYSAVAQGKAPACMLFSKEIDSLAAAGAVLADVWQQENKMPVVDCLGDEFLEYVTDGMTITVSDDGTVTAE